MVSSKHVKALASFTSIASVCLLANAFSNINYATTIQRDVAPRRLPKRISPLSSPPIFSSDKKVRTSTTSTTGTTTCLFAEKKLWDRLGLQEGQEPCWYLINCVAGLEIDLLRQCRESCEHMEDAHKFIVPTEKKTRSHGANRMVTENKVKYPGYVFAKLRLCKEVYQAIQELDLCRSWMGTVNQKGYRKLPPKPMPLNELEVENFGLENEEYESDIEQGMQNLDIGEDEVILDDEDDEQEEKRQEAKAKEREEILKDYLGLEVEDMVKVTRGKFLNEDGIIRRLKDNRILVRFYTYGTMFEEWMDPTFVRKLSAEEVLRGLSGPSTPIMQREFDNPGGAVRDSRGRYNDENSSRPSSLRRDLMGNVNRGGGLRNTRRDRVQRGDQYKRDRMGLTADERAKERKNWDWYQEQQRERKGNKGMVSDDEWDYKPQSGDDESGGGGRIMSKRAQRRNQQLGEQRQQQQQKQQENDDWSAFVSPAASPSSGGEDSSSSDSDDFFESLMTDLSNELGGGSSSGGSSNRQESKRTRGDNSRTTSNRDSDSSSKEEDDFFASLMTEINSADDLSSSSSSSGGSKDTSNDDDDFFAMLADDISGTTDDSKESGGGKSRLGGKPKNEFENDELFASDDDFFNSLAAELDDVIDEEKTIVGSSNSGSSSSSDNGDDSSLDDFFASLESEVEESLRDDRKSNNNNDPAEDVDVVAAAPKTKTKSKAAVAETSSSTMSAADLEKYTVPVLKDMLRERGLKVSGKKAELIERLGAH